MKLVNQASQPLQKSGLDAKGRRRPTTRRRRRLEKENPLTRSQKSTRKFLELSKCIDTEKAKSHNFPDAVMVRFAAKRVSYSYASDEEEEEDDDGSDDEDYGKAKKKKASPAKKKGKAKGRGVRVAKSPRNKVTSKGPPVTKSLFCEHELSFADL